MRATAIFKTESTWILDKNKSWIHSHFWTSLHKFLLFCTTYCICVKQHSQNYFKMRYFLKNIENVLRSAFSINGWFVKKSSTASIQYVVLDNFYKLNWFLLIFYSLHCFHYVVLLLLCVVTFVDFVRLYSVISP